MKEIPLTQGYVALVDDEDYERLIAMGKWHVFKSKSRKQPSVYAARHESNTRDIIFMHSIVTGYRPVDHKDTNGLNNQKYNLRRTNHTLNMANSRPIGGSSPFKGVSFQKQTRTWSAKIKVNGKLKHLGSFKDEVDAATVYNFAAYEEWGEYARLNTPLTGEQL